MQLTYIAGWKIPVHRGALTQWISKNGSGGYTEINPVFSPLIPLKAFLEIDYTESLPLRWIPVAPSFQSNFIYIYIPFYFLQSRDSRLFHYTARCQVCKAWTSRPSLYSENKHRRRGNETNTCFLLDAVMPCFSLILLHHALTPFPVFEKKKTSFLTAFPHNLCVRNLAWAV